MTVDLIDLDERSSIALGLWKTANIGSNDWNGSGLSFGGNESSVMSSPTTTIIESTPQSPIEFDIVKRHRRQQHVRRIVQFPDPS